MLMIVIVCTLVSTLGLVSVSGAFNENVYQSQLYHQELEAVEKLTSAGSDLSKDAKENPHDASVGGKGSRILLPQYSLGPAPFPDISTMDFKLYGDAILLKGSARLTEDIQSQKGAIWGTKPVTLVKEWQADLSFRVGGSKNKEFFGDGFAFWYAKESGQVGEALGGPEKWTGLGVFFDTYKNEHFRTKKHPYVYGIVSNGQKPYLEISKDAPGCHIPFRNPDPEKLDTTIARITYKQKIVSVVMQPKGAVDWVQCFKIHNVDLPIGGYFGLTAMTGGLSDKHHFQQLAVFANANTQPYDYAHENDPRQMPQMWEAMRHSGHEARMFEIWENPDFHEEMKFKVAKRFKNGHDGVNDADDGETDNYTDDDLYNENNDAEDIYADPYEQYDYNDATADEEDEGEERNEQDPTGDRKKMNHLDFEAKLREDEARIKDLLSQIQTPGLSRELANSHHSNANKMKRIHHHLQRQMQQVTNELHETVRRIRAKEHELNERILKISQALQVDIVNAFEKEMEGSHGGWFWPFILTLLLLAGIAFYGHTRYKKFMKHHLL